MAESLQDLQQRICRTYLAGNEPPAPGPKVGLAIQTLGRVPIHGVRLVPSTRAPSSPRDAAR